MSSLVRQYLKVQSRQSNPFRVDKRAERIITVGRPSTGAKVHPDKSPEQCHTVHRIIPASGNDPD